MSNETSVTVVGNLTADPQLAYTSSGVAVASFTIASTPRTFDRATSAWTDGTTLFLRCSLWRQAAQHAADGLARGTRVIAHGRLRQRSYQTSAGEQRTVIELQVEEIGPSIRYASVQVTPAAHRPDKQQDEPDEGPDDEPSALEPSPAAG